jgi:hypothetical protein
LIYGDESVYNISLQRERSLLGSLRWGELFNMVIGDTTVMEDDPTIVFFI